MDLNKKLLTLMFGMVFVFIMISGVSASQENFGTYEKGKNIELLQLTSAYNNCNITSVLYPNSSKAISEVEMTKDGYEFSYNFNKTNIVGEYKVNGFCTDGNTTETFVYYFKVTEDGTEITEARSTIIISLLGVLVLFLFGSLYGLFKVEDHRGKLAFYWVSHLLLILISFISWQIGVEGLLNGFALTSIFRIMFLFFTISAFPMVILSIVWIVYIHTFNEHFQKLIDKGNDPETAFSMTKKKKGGWLHGK